MKDLNAIQYAVAVGWRKGWLTMRPDADQVIEHKTHNKSAEAKARRAKYMREYMQKRKGGQA
jgi:hypothetical protein